MRTAILAAALSLCATASIAQQSCIATPLAYKHLAEARGQTQIWIGEQPDKHLLEIWVNNETGTWTLIGTIRGELGGMSCILSHGTGYASGKAL